MLLLRITVPVDVYSSPIIVQIDGVEVKVVALTDVNNGSPNSKARSDAERKKKRSQRRRNSVPGEQEGLDSVLPTANDLATSFLQTEPPEKKAELEADFSSQSQYLAASTVGNDDSEEDLMLGTGTSLALPAFMANFLQGIVDRLQIKVRGIALDLELPLPSDSLSQSPTTLPSDTVTFHICIDNVDIEGVTFNKTEETLGYISAESHKHALKTGKRLISLRNLRGMLTSDASLFASLAQSSSPSSPSATHSNISESRTRSWSSKARSSSNYEPSHIDSIHEEPPFEESTASLPADDDTGSRTFTSTSAPTLSAASAIASDSGRFEDAPEDDIYHQEQQSLFDSTSSLSNSSINNSKFLDGVIDSRFLDDGDVESDDITSLTTSRNKTQTLQGGQSPSSTPRASVLLPHHPPGESDTSGLLEHTDSHITPQSTILPNRPRSRFAENRVSRSQPFLDTISHQDSRKRKESEAPSVANKLQPEYGEDSNTSSPTSNTPAMDELAQSMIFSHADAESMYMSALSEPDVVHDRIPGAWDTSSENSEPTVWPDASEDMPSPRVTHVDDLDQNLNADANIPLIESRDSPTRRPSDAAMPRIPEESPRASATASAHSSQHAISSDGYLRVTKQLFSLDQVAIYLPPSSRAGDVEDPFQMSTQSILAKSTSDRQSETFQSTSDIPGAFSTSFTDVPHAKQHRPNKSSQIPNLSSEGVSSSLEVSIGQCNIQFDVSIGRIFVRLFSVVSDLVKSDEPKPGTKSQESATSPLSFQFQAEIISVKFLDRLAGTMTASNSEVKHVTWTQPPPDDVLLRTTLQGLNADVDIAQAATKARVTLQKFIFGYAKENIMSFDADLRMRSSVRDLAASAGVDLSMDVTRTSASTRIKLSTLPLHVSVDLQKLDEAFSWFGGLSGVLNMGSSIASTATMTTTSPVKPPAKSRGVRFETPIKPDDSSLSAENKFDARIGGLVLDLIGRNCSIGMDTSAVKIVSREEGVGIAVDKAKISGPHLHGSNEDPAILAEITTTRIEYLNTPKDTDLDRLLALITPSKAKYDRDDDILLDTLLRQRRQGAIVRITIDSFRTHVARLAELKYLPELGDELSRLSTVTKYLPEDDRPGLLCLFLIRDVDIHVDVGPDLGTLRARAENIEAAQITLPALVALSVASVAVHRNSTEELMGIATRADLRDAKDRSPVIMARMIGDEMEPVVKIRLWNLKVEYRVATLMALLGLSESTTADEMAASIATSVATLTNRAQPEKAAAETAKDPTTSKTSDKPMMMDIILRDCVIGLNPLGLPSKVLVVMTEAHACAIMPKDNNTEATFDLNKGSILVIDDISNISPEGTSSRPKRISFDGGSSQVADLCALGFVSVSYISSAKAVVHVTGSKEQDEKFVDIELRDDLFVLESCADSTQTLIAVLNGLKPPTPPSTDIKYRTKVIPVEDLLASLSGDAFGTAEGNYDFDDDFGPDIQDIENFHEDEEEEDLELDINSRYYQERDVGASYRGDLVEYESQEGSLLFDQLISRDTNDGVLLENISEVKEPEAAEELDFREDHFGTGSILEGTAHRWNSAKNTYDRSNVRKVKESPLKVCIRDVHIIWNLFDGYDWQHTRDAITKAVQDVESKAIENRVRNARRPTFDQEIEDDNTVIGDCLFNSIYISIPANRDPRELAMDINQELNDNATETESIATTIRSTSPSRSGGARPRPKRLRLQRSKHHKITFELKGVNVDLVAFPPGSGETQSSIDIRVLDFDIFDHIPTSTWKKFATYMHDAGERETGSSQIHIEILNVKPMPDLAASEIVLKATVLPLRLHVDQDALDFITRFFEFKDDSAPNNISPADVPFIQRAEVNSVQVKLDFKPKRVDYAGLRSGHTTEFMNFIVLDEANMTLRHTIIYGVSGFDKLGKCLNDIWMPDVKRNQLPGILAGLAPVRSLANVGGGVRDLVMVPISEYKKDGRVVRSLRKGATAFGRTTGIELMKLAAKVAIGTQTALQGAEDLMKPSNVTDAAWEDMEHEEEEKKMISPYADQPVGVWQGMRGGYAGLARDLLTTRDAIIAIPGEVMETGTARGAAKAISKGLPTIVLTPVRGVAEAVGKTLMGATNSLDPQNRRRMDEVGPLVLTIRLTLLTCLIEIQKWTIEAVRGRNLSQDHLIHELTKDCTYGVISTIIQTGLLGHCAFYVFLSSAFCFLYLLLRRLHITQHI